MTKKVKIKFKSERVILSDVLPYEVPLAFSNRRLYRFIVENRIKVKDGHLTWKEISSQRNDIIKLIFGISDTNVDGPPTRSDQSLRRKAKLLKSTIPFSYSIKHKSKEFRQLNICHPNQQLEMADFYHKYQSVILYYCSKSPFSIRKPTRVAKFIYYKDATHFEKLGEHYPSIEESNKEYENLKSYFSYEEYSNVHKFYESRKFHTCEKKYNNLMKLDISKCFDSIYTHSVVWAIIGKSFCKNSPNHADTSFGGKFDKLISKLNHNETNGIIIGPEFSRIFCELILQQVDYKLEILLRKKGFKHKTDYEIFRYVDDYFIFYNDDETKDSIVDLLQTNLRNFKLNLNSEKEKIYGKPIITEISIAKARISNLLKNVLRHELVYPEKQGEEPSIEHKPKGKIYINSKNLISDFKTIIKECGVEYKDLLNYSLTLIESRSRSILKNYLKTDITLTSETQIVKSIIEIIEFTFFMYAVSPRVNTTIKLCRLVSLFISFFRRESKQEDLKEILLKCIHDNIFFILKKHKQDNETQLETLYLLTVLPELGRKYWLSEEQLGSYFGITVEGHIGEKSLNYFSITTLLFYIKNKKRYSKLRKFINSYILEKFRATPHQVRHDAELTLLLIDTLSCPFIETQTKLELLKIYGIKQPPQAQLILRDMAANSLSFTKWINFNLEKELDAKRSKEVY